MATADRVARRRHGFGGVRARCDDRDRLGAGGAPQVSVLDVATTADLSSFPAYAPGFAGGVRVAAADVNGDGVADVVTGAGPGGGPQAKVFDGLTGAETRSFFAAAPTFAGGVYVAARASAPAGQLVDLIAAVDGVGPGSAAESAQAVTATR